MLLLCPRAGMGNHFKAIEYGGEAVARHGHGSANLVLANMAAELGGGDVALVEPDATTLAHISAPMRGKVEEADIARWRSDEGAPYERVFALDALHAGP